MQQAGMITIVPAHGGMHAVNCPFFDPSTVFEHQSIAEERKENRPNITTK
jgi:hypothetical protein